MAYVDLGAWYKIFMGSLTEIIWTKKKNQQSAPSQPPVLAKAIWAIWVSIPFCSNLFWKLCMTNLGQVNSYELLFGFFKKTNCTKQEFWRIHTLSTTSPSKVYLGQFGSYPILFDFLSKWCYQNFWYYSKNVSKSFSRDINIKSLSPQEIQDISNKLIS